MNSKKLAKSNENERRQTYNTLMNKQRDYRAVFLGCFAIDSAFSEGNEPNQKVCTRLITIAESMLMEEEAEAAKKGEVAVRVIVSKHGITCIDLSNNVALFRQPLYSIQRYFGFTDFFGRLLLIIQTSEGASEKNELYVMQVEAPDRRAEICSVLDIMFEIIQQFD